MAELAAAPHRPAVPAQDDRHRRLLRRVTDVSGALDRAALLPDGADLVAVAADRGGGGDKPVWLPLPAGGSRGRTAEIRVVRRGVSCDRCRVLPRRPDALAAMGLSVQFSAGGRCALPTRRLRRGRARARHRPADRRSHLRLFRSPEDQPELHGERFSVDRVSDHQPTPVRQQPVGGVRIRGAVHTGRIRHWPADATLPPRLAMVGRLHASVYPGHVRARGPELEQRDMAVDCDNGGIRRPVVLAGLGFFVAQGRSEARPRSFWRRSCCLRCFPC
jgi:hypothetical protein